MPRQTAKKRKCEEAPPKSAVIESCLFCGMNLQDEDTKLKSEERLKLFEATCMFLNITSEDNQWDFDKESFPFCNSCTVFVQEFGALYDELEVVHCKIARLVDSVKEVVKAGSHPHSTKMKRSKRGSSDTSSKLESVRHQIITSLRIGDSGDEPSKDADVSVNLKDSFSGSSPRKAAKAGDGETSKKSSDTPRDGTRSPPASVKETDHECLEVNGVTDESEEEDEFEAYVKEQLEILKAKGGDSSENEEVIPVDKSLEEQQIKVEDASDIAPSEDPFAAEMPQSSDQTVASGTKNSQTSVKLSNGGSEQLSTTAGFGTVVGERYKKFILTPKPDFFVTSVTPHGFKFGPVTVEAKGRAYHCSLCPTFVVYDDKDLILDHIEMVHFGTDHWYPCEYCELSFRLIGQLHVHRKSSHPGCKDRKWTFMCSVCNKRFFDKDMAEEHSNVDHTAELDRIEKSVRSRECVEERRCDKKSTKTNDNIHGPSPSNVEEPASEKNLVLAPLPFQLRRRSTRKKSVAETSTSDVEVVEGDEGDADSDVKSSKNANPAPLAKRKTGVKMVDAAQTVLLDVAKSVAETSAETDIPLSKLVLCGGCGCRYFSESASAVSTIKKHGVHHKTQKAFPCRLCTSCFTSLQEMVDHVRNHSLEPKFKDYVFYSPL